MRWLTLTLGILLLATQASLWLGKGSLPMSGVFSAHSTRRRRAMRHLKSETPVCLPRSMTCARVLKWWKRRPEASWACCAPMKFWCR